MAINQLRIYEIFEHNKMAFHARFRDHASRLMREHGFRLLGAWETHADGRFEFAYLLDWQDEATMERSWAQYRADPRWQDVKASTTAAHGELIGYTIDRVLVPTPYPVG